MVDTVHPESVEPEVYPDTSIFVNLLGVKTSKEMKEKEGGITFLRTLELLQKPELISQTFDFSHLRAIHKYLFQDIYSWAGKPRSYDVKKGNDLFTPSDCLMKYESQVFQRSIDFLQRTEKPSKEDAAKQLASCLGIINIYHPFPEGNGRTQRVFISCLAAVFDFSVDWDKVHAWEMVETSKAYHNGNPEPLEYLMMRIVSESPL
ncbi:Fic/DOC family protein [Vibrio coralliirubri]|uniref:Fic/DOC family protein n=1 Tax=Vibrio coralliirubri TaxID=1516159 RepID=UPI0006372589|nr:Fic family protein [Vibrio coralliirubri]CDT07742.1 putative Protein involved in cell division [Vibrio coralliirubri]CDT78350.1 putative Protein involved in cell division [Vibrio coralliirubri]